MHVDEEETTVWSAFSPCVPPGIMASKLLSTTLEAASVPILEQLSKVAFWSQVVSVVEMLGWVGDYGGQELESSKVKNVRLPVRCTSGSWLTSMKDRRRTTPAQSWISETD